MNHSLLTSDLHNPGPISRNVSWYVSDCIGVCILLLPGRQEMAKAKLGRAVQCCPRSLVTHECAKGHISQRVFLTDRVAIEFHCSFWKHSLRGILSSEVISANVS